MFVFSFLLVLLVVVCILCSVVRLLLAFLWFALCTAGGRVQPGRTVNPAAVLAADTFFCALVWLFFSLRCCGAPAACLCSLVSLRSPLLFRWGAPAMSLIGIDAGSLAGAPAGEGVQTLHDLSSRNQMVTQHLKQALDTLDEKNKRIQELDNKCAEYENLLTKHGEKAFNSFDKRLEEFKTHHVWTVKQVR